MRYLLISLTFFAFANAGYVVCAQSASSDSVLLSASVDHAINSYNAVMKNQALLFNGREYLEFDGLSKQHPYFESEFEEEGAIEYEHQWYTKIPMLYDLTIDALVVEHYDQRGFRVLVKVHQDDVQSFDLLDHHFVRLQADSLNAVKEGFYDLLYQGDTKFYVKRKKNIHEDLSNNEVNVEFIGKNTFYVEKNSIFHVVRGKGSLYKVLKDQKKALKQFASKNQLDFVGAKERSMVELVMYYDQIKNH